MIETGRADIDGDDARSRMTERELCGLPRSTSSNQNIQIGSIFFVRPQQMILGAMNVSRVRSRFSRFSSGGG
jgi:hypothetical protein